MFSAANGAPDSALEVLLLPLLFTFFAVASRIGARMYWRNFGKRKKHEWYVYPLLALALLFGYKWIHLMYFADSLDRTMYLQTLTMRKVRVAHYLAFIMPLIATIWIVLYDVRERARLRRQPV